MIKKICFIGLLGYVIFLNYTIVSLEKNLESLNSRVCITDSECENYEYSY